MLMVLCGMTIILVLPKGSRCCSVIMMVPAGLEIRRCHDSNASVIALATRNSPLCKQSIARCKHALNDTQTSALRLPQNASVRATGQESPLRKKL